MRSRNTIDAMNSAQWTPSGLSAMGTSSVVIEGLRSAEDEGEGDADDRERLGEGEADEGGAQHRAPSLRLPGGALDHGGEDQADADTGADGAEAVADDAERAGEFQGGHEGRPFVSRRAAETEISAPQRSPRRCTGR